MRKISGCLFLFIAVVFTRSHAQVVLQLKSKVYIQNPHVSFGELFQNTLDLNYNIYLKESKVLYPSEISRYLISAGIREFVIVGQGVEVVYLPQLLTYSDFTNRYASEIVSAFPQANFFPAEFYPIRFESYSYEENRIYRLIYVEFPEGKAREIERVFIVKNHPASVNVYLPATNIVTPVIPKGEMIVEMFGQDKVELVYRSGGIEIRSPARILRDLGNNFYLVENLQNGKKLKARRVN